MRDLHGNSDWHNSALKVFVLALSLSWSTISVASGPSFISILNSIQPDQKIQQIKHEVISQFQIPTHHDLKPIVQTDTGSLKTTKLQHYYKGLEVIGSSLLIHENGFDTKITQDFLLETLISVTPKTKAKTIELLIDARYPAARLTEKPTLKLLPDLDHQETRLVYWAKTNTLGKITNLIFDAHSGALIAEVPVARNIAPIHVLSAKKIPNKAIDPHTGKPLLMKPQWLTLEASSTTGSSSKDQSVQNALNHFDRILNFFDHRFGLDSYDNQGTSVVAVVHVGKNYSNAYWNSQSRLMAFGDGDGYYMKDMTNALDVTGHEFTHAVNSGLIKAGSYEGLLYFSQSGALSEAIADYFGEVIESQTKGTHDWIIGEDLYYSKKLSLNGMRNIKSPTNKKSFYITKKGKQTMKPYPDHVSNLFDSYSGCSDMNDLCYVHTNSTVVSHALYLLTQEIGEQLTSKLVFHTIAHYLTPSSKFKSFAKSMRKSSEDLKLSMSEMDAVDNSLIAVGL